MPPTFDMENGGRFCCSASVKRDQLKRYLVDGHGASSSRDNQNDAHVQTFFFSCAGRLVRQSDEDTNDVTRTETNDGDEIERRTRKNVTRTDNAARNRGR